MITLKTNVTSVIRWQPENGGCVMARLELEAHKTEWLYQCDVDVEFAEIVGNSLIKKLKEKYL